MGCLFIYFEVVCVRLSCLPAFDHMLNKTAFYLSQDHPRMRAFSYSCSLPVTWQRWRSHHSIHRIRKLHAASKHHGSMFDRTAVIADRSFTVQEYEFSTFSGPVTLVLTRWPSYANPIDPYSPWRYTACANVNFLRQGFRKLSSERHTYIHTDRHYRQTRPKLYTTRVQSVITQHNRIVCIHERLVVEMIRGRFMHIHYWWDDSGVR